MNIIKRKTSILLSVIFALLLGLSFILAFSFTVVEAEDQSIYTFTRTSDTECSVRLKDKTVSRAILPSTTILDGKEYVVTAIASNGFASAANLEKVRIPKTIKTIGNGAFMSCKKLETITLPAVESIGSNAFALDAQLKYLVIPKSVNAVGATILRNTSTTKIYVRGDEGSTLTWNANWNTITGSTKAETEYDSNFTPPIEYEFVDTSAYNGEISTYGISPEGYWIVAADQSFADPANPIHVYIPAEHTEDGVTYPVRGIEANAFSDNYIATLTVGFDENPINIDSYAFNGMLGNTIIIINRDITLNDSFESITSTNVFSYSELSIIILPTSISVIGSYMFDSCTVKYLQFKEPQSGLSKVQERALINDVDLTGVVELPASVTTIEEGAFQNTVEISKIHISKAVTNLGSAIFVGWDDKQSIVIDYEHEQDALDAGWNEFWSENCPKDIIEFNTSYTITYYRNGGSEEGNPTTYKSIDTIIFNIPERKGYTFEGWYENENFTGEPVTGIPAKSKGNKEFFAKWKTNTYFIQYKENKNPIMSNKMTGQTETSVHEYGTASSLTKNGFYVLGWKFIGWNTNWQGEGESFEDGATVETMTSEPNETIILYAQWEEIAYTVHCEPNKPKRASREVVVGENIGETANQVVKYEFQSFYASREIFTLVGWNCIGFSANPDGSGAFYKIGKSFRKLIKSNDEVITCYAQWKEVETCIIYDPNLPTVYESIVGKMDPTIFLFEDGNKILPPMGLSMRGWRFTGWNFYEVNNHLYWHGEDQADVSFLSWGFTFTLVAQWENVRFSIHYNGNNPGDPYFYGTMADSVFTYYSADAAELPLNKFVAHGYRFIGWSDDAGNFYKDGEKCVYKWSDIDGTVINLYAQWVENDYFIKFEGNKPSRASNQVFGEDIIVEMQYSVSKKLPTNPYTLKGWKFRGWNTMRDGKGTYYGNEQEIKNLTREENATVILYAQWLTNSYTVECYSNLPKEFADTGLYEKRYADYDSIISFNTGGEIKHWAFINWNTEPDGSGISYEASTIYRNLTDIDGGVVKLYAQWIPNIYTVYYYNNIPQGFNAPGIYPTITYLDYYLYEEVDIPQIYSIPGLRFKEWSTMPDGSGSIYRAGTERAALSRITGEIVYLYAQWEII